MRSGAMAGLPATWAKKISRMRLKSHHAAGHATVLGLGTQQGQHGLVPPVHTVKIADGQGTGLGQAGVVKTAKNLHRPSVVFKTIRRINKNGAFSLYIVVVVRSLSC